MGKKTDVCRVCLESQQTACVQLSEKYQDFILYEFINNITNLNIRLSDGFPDKICVCCYSILKSSIDFKEKCEASDLILRSQTVKEEILPAESAVKYKNEPSDIKIEYSDDDTDYAVDLETEPIKQEVSNEQCLNPDQQPVEVVDKKIVTNPELTKPSRAKDLKLICDDCGGSFKSKCKLKVHWKKTHMLNALVCPFCKRAFKSYKAFNLHKKNKSKSCAIASNKNVSMEGVGKDRVFCCNVCNYKSQRAKDICAHIVTHTGDRPYTCNICKKTYTQQSSLQGHQETAHGIYVLEITCHYCGMYVKGRRKISRHLRSHTKIECNVCHKIVNKLSYPHHLKRHTGVKRYACEKCASTFYTIAELCNHKRLKHGRTTFLCNECDFTTKNEHTMKNHKSKHITKNIPCTICGRFFLTDEKLAMHQRTHFTEKKHSCPQCESKFFKRDSLTRHLKSKHLIVAEKLKPLLVKKETFGVPQAEVTDITE